MRQFLALAMAAAVAMGSLLTTAPSHAQAKKDIVIGLQCDRTGATQIVGTVLCPGFHDYVALVNSKGGVEGFQIKALEIDHEYTSATRRKAPSPWPSTARRTSTRWRPS